jgi:hypothetical protein
MGRMVTRMGDGGYRCGRIFLGEGAREARGGRATWYNRGFEHQPYRNFFP